MNIAQVQDSASLARLAAVIRTRHDDTGPVITNFRYYPANVVKFYARRQTQEWRYFVRDAMPPGARRYAIVHGDAAAGFRNIEVAHLTSDGDYDLLLLRNTGPAPVRPASAGPAPAHTGNGAEKSGYP